MEHPFLRPNFLHHAFTLKMLFLLPRLSAHCPFFLANTSGVSSSDKYFGTLCGRLRDTILV